MKPPKPLRCLGYRKNCRLAIMGSCQSKGSASTGASSKGAPSTGTRPKTPASKCCGDCTPQHQTTKPDGINKAKPASPPETAKANNPNNTAAPPRTTKEGPTGTEANEGDVSDRPSSKAGDWMKPLDSARESQRNAGVLETRDSEAESVTEKSTMYPSNA